MRRSVPGTAPAITFSTHANDQSDLDSVSDIASLGRS